MYPGTITLKSLMVNFFRNLWWTIRGVDTEEYRSLCARCGRTGQVHFSLRNGLHRFRKTK